MRSFNCDMYWPLLKRYLESSGFGLVGFILGGFTIRGKGLYYVQHRTRNTNLYYRGPSGQICILGPKYYT